MAVAIPGTTQGSITSEYAATSVTTTTAVILNASGVLVPSRTASINYARKTYLLNANGDRIGIVSTQDPNAGPATMGAPRSPGTDPTIGYVAVDAATMSGYLAAQANVGDTVETLNDTMVDALISTDLIKRGIIPAPAAPATPVS